MRVFHFLFFILFIVFLGCRNPTSNEVNSTIGDDSTTLPSNPTSPVEQPTAPVISGNLSLTTDDSTQRKARTVSWSGITYTSNSPNAKFELAVGYDDDSNGFDSDDINNVVDWFEPTNSLQSTNYQIVDGTDNLSLLLKSSTNYYISIRATDQNALTSNVQSSAAWQTLAPPLWYPGNSNWLDASDSNTLFQNTACSLAASSNNDPIQCWMDKSSSGTHALDTASAADPTLLAPGLNGLNMVDFNGSEGLLIPTNVSLNSALGFHLFIILIQNGHASNQAVYRGRPNGAYGTQPGISFEITNSQYQNTIFEDANGNALGFSSIGALPTTPTLHRLDFGNGGTPFELFQNGTNTGLTPNAGANGNPGGLVNNSTISIGYNAWDNSRNLHGQIGEIILFTTNLTTDQKNTMEGYLACKWNLQGSLPGGHPYSSTCP